jgi:hypothetical protein
MVIVLRDKENQKDEELEMLLKIKVLKEMRRKLTEELSFGDFFYLNIKHMSAIDFFIDEKESNHEIYNLNIKMEILIGVRLLLGHKQLFLANLNKELTESLQTSVNFENIELALMNYKNVKINNLLINKGNVWKDKLWFNHLFHMFYPFVETVPKLSHYKNAYKKSFDFVNTYDDLTCIIFFVFTEKISEKALDISISEKKDFRYGSLPTLFVRGFNDLDYLSNLALINLIRLYCYENKILISMSNQPLLTNIIYDTFKPKIIKNDDMKDDNNSIGRKKQIVYLQDLQKLLEHIIYSIRVEYPEKFSAQITVDRLEKLIEQYGNLAIRTIMANPAMYLMLETEEFDY